MMLAKNHRIYIAGHTGLVGSALLRTFQDNGYSDLITRKRAELDLLDQAAVRSFMDTQKPDVILLAAAKVGGIASSIQNPASFIYENLAIQTNVISLAQKAGVKDLLFIGSSCIYPRDTAQPMPEDALMTGPLEPTNTSYAVAKIAGIHLCKAYNSQYGTRFNTVIPPNLYGPGDNFDPESGHVIASLIKRLHTAKEENAASISLWGTGTARREFLHSDDLAEACLFLLECNEIPNYINVGSEEDITIRELAHLIANIVGFRGEILFDNRSPDGMPRKLLDSQKIRTLGWQPRIPLEEGIKLTYEHYCLNSFTMV